MPASSPNSALPRTHSRLGRTSAWLALLFVSIAACAPASGGENVVSAKLSKDTAQLGERISLVLAIAVATANGGGSELPDDVKMPFIEGLRIINAGQRQEVHQINRSLTLRSVHEWQIIPKKSGAYTLPPFTLTIDGKEYSSQPLKLNVLPGPNGELEATVMVKALAEPTNLSADTIGTLEVRVLNVAAAPKQPEIPRIDGLVLNYRDTRADDDGFTFIYAYGPTRDGEVTIPAVPVAIDGKTYSSKPIKLSVSPWQSVHATTTASKREIFVGEPLLTEWAATVAGGFRVSNAGLPWADELKDWVVRPLAPRAGRNQVDIGNEVRQLLAEVTTDSGKNICRIRRVLIPWKTGEQEITPGWIEVGAPFQRQRLVSYSAPLTIKVLPLPEEGRPRDLRAPIPVGKFEYSAELRAKATPMVGEALELVRIIKGRGNLEAIDLQPITTNDSLAVYDQASELKLETDGLSGTKTFRQPIAFKQPGKQSLGKLDFCYFDPDTRTYQTLPAAVPEIDVKAPANAPAPLAGTPTTPPPPSHAEPKRLAEDVGDVVDEGLLNPPPGKPWRDWPFIAALAIGPCLALTGYLLGRRRRLMQDQGFRRSAQAFNNANSNLAESRKLAAAGKEAEAVACAASALRSYLCDKTARAEGELTPAEAAQIMRELGFEAKLSRNCELLLTEADQCRFGGGVAGGAVEYAQRCADILTQFEKGAGK